MLLLSAEISQVDLECAPNFRCLPPRPRFNVELVCSLVLHTLGGRLIGRNIASRHSSF